MADHSQHAGDVRTALLLGTAVAGVILAPYLLPALGLGTFSVAQGALTALHSLSEGSGLAALASQVVSYIPIIGPAAAKGGLFSAMLSAGTGLAAVFGYELLPKNSTVRAIGKMLKYGLLATSALIALPTTLAGLSNGLIYLADEFGGSALAASVIDLVKDTLGTIPFSNHIVSHATSASGLLPHLTTCGLSFFTSGSAFAIDEMIHSGSLSETEKSNLIAAFSSLSKDQKLSTLRSLHNKGYHGAHVHDGKLTFDDHLSMAHH